MERDYSRIAILLSSDLGVVHRLHKNRKYSVMGAARLLFPRWKNRGRCLNLDDYLDTIGFTKIQPTAPYRVNDFLIYMEVVYNMWYMSDDFIAAYSDSYEWGTDGALLKSIMDEVLSEMNQKAYYDPETEQCLIGEDSPQVTAAVEASERETASQMLRYNHRQLAGDIAGKRVILKNLADYIEGRKDELKSINAQLLTDINSAVNNLSIRHNNLDPRNPNRYKEKLAKMSPEGLEKWYDDVYQMILLAILEMDNVERRDHVRTMIQEINQ